MKDKKLITKIIHGSRLYGTNTPTSDEDFKSVHIPSGRDILLGKAFKVTENGTKSDFSKKNSSEDIDDSSYSMSKFLRLIVDGDTSAIEILLAPDQFRLETSEEFKYIYDNRFKLMNRKCRGYVGYCKTQSLKYSLKGSRLNAAKDVLSLLSSFNSNSKLGAFSDQVLKFSENTEHCSLELITMPSGSSIFHLNVCDKLAPYTNTVKSAIETYQKLLDNYGQRAIQASENKNLDFKALSHAVRVGEQAIELISTGNLVFPRPNASYLLDIKKGKIPYSDVSKSLEYLLDKVEEVTKTSPLQESTDQTFVEDMIVKFHRDQIS